MAPSPTTMATAVATANPLNSTVSEVIDVVEILEDDDVEEEDNPIFTILMSGMTEAGTLPTQKINLIALVQAKAQSLSDGFQVETTVSAIFREMLQMTIANTTVPSLSVTKVKKWTGAFVASKLIALNTELASSKLRHQALKNL
jgi:hypothetical protein